jgi:hypothetical protein
MYAQLTTVENIMFKLGHDDEFQVKLVDFGFTSRMGEKFKGGTHRYAPPELYGTRLLCMMFGVWV